MSNDNNNTAPATGSSDLGRFSNEQLRQAVCLLVRPEWLRERGVMIAILQTLDYNSADVAEVLESQQPLHDGPQLML